MSFNVKHRIDISLFRGSDESGEPDYRVSKRENMGSVAPQCKLLSLKVLDEDGAGNVSNLIAALGYVNELNAGGRRVVVQGVNLSVGYEFEAEWFACGHSPLCVGDIPMRLRHQTHAFSCQR